MARTPLSSDLNLTPISAPTGSILDMVESAAEEMFDTYPGTSRAALETDALRTVEMDQAQLAGLLPKTRPPPVGPRTVAMRPPRTDPTEPVMEILASDPDPESLLAHVEPRSSGVRLKVVLVLAALAGALSAWWWLRGF